MAEGLAFSTEALKDTQQGCNLLGPLYSQSGGRSIGDRVLGFAGAAREGPGEVGKVSHPAVGRWRQERFPEDWQGKAYRPKTLSPLESDLGRFDLASIRDYREVHIV